MMKVITDTWLYHPSLFTVTSDPDMTTAHQNIAFDGSENAAVMYFLNIKHGRVPDAERLTLGELLILCCRFKATNPKDRVFALVGLARKAEPPLVAIDYTRTTAQVYTQTIVNILRQESRSLDILANAGIGYPRSAELSILPSWVPDWSSIRVTKPLAIRKTYKASIPIPSSRSRSQALPKYSQLLVSRSTPLPPQQTLYTSNDLRA